MFLETSTAAPGAACFPKGSSSRTEASVSCLLRAGKEPPPQPTASAQVAGRQLKKDGLTREPQRTQTKFLFSLPWPCTERAHARGPQMRGWWDSLALCGLRWSKRGSLVHRAGVSSLSRGLAAHPQSPKDQRSPGKGHDCRCTWPGKEGPPRSQRRLR